MDWITRASNERNAERHRREAIRRGAPVLWDNICRSIEQAVREYRELNDSFPVEFSGRADHTVAVMLFEPEERGKGQERETVSITFNQEALQVEVRYSHGGMSIFPVGLNSSGQVCLKNADDSDISVEKFTEI